MPPPTADWVTATGEAGSRAAASAASASRSHHVELAAEEGGYRLRDLGSKNGTRYGEELLARAEGDLAKAARKAGLTRTALLRLLGRHGLLPP